MVRSLVALVVAAALEAAALGAPLFHAHLDGDEHDHHGAARIHAHLGGHHHALPRDHDHGPAVESAERGERPIGLQLFAAVEAPIIGFPSLPQARFALLAPLESIMRRPPIVAHAHDPPDASATGPRAPPLPSV